MEQKTNSQDRFFWGMLLGLVLLALLAVVIAWARRKDTAYRTDNSPSATVYNYILALQRNDWERAYQLLSDEMPCKPSLMDFGTEMQDFQLFSTVDIVGETFVDDNHAWVTIFFRQEEAPFRFSMMEYPARVTLVRENGQWKILELPSELEGSWYWRCD